MLTGWTEHWQFYLGPILILIALFTRGGYRRSDREGGAVVETLLRIDNLAKRFGSLAASDGLSLDVVAGELHAIIGPNGAGKTTLITQLSGEMAPRCRRDPVCRHATSRRLPPTARAALGLARSFQITSLFLDYTALDNVALAVQAQPATRFRFWRDARARSARCASRRLRRSRGSG